MRVHNELENVAKTPLKKTLKTPVKKPTVKTLKKRNKNVKKPKLIKVASVSLWRPVVLRVCRPTRLPSYASAILRACRPTRLPSYASAVLRVCRLTRPPSYAGRRRIDYSSVSALSGNFPVSPPPHRPPAAALSLRAMNPTRRVESFESALMSVESDPVASGGGAMPICGRWLPAPAGRPAGRVSPRQHVLIAASRLWWTRRRASLAPVSSLISGVRGSGRSLHAPCTLQIIYVSRSGGSGGRRWRSRVSSYLRTTFARCQ